MDKYRLLAYKSAIERERKNLESQKDWLAQTAWTFEEALKSKVAMYFSSILCEFDEECYQEALKSLGETCQRGKD